MNKRYLFKGSILAAAVLAGSILSVAGDQGASAEALTTGFSAQEEILPPLPESLTDAEMDRLTAEYQEGPLMLAPETQSRVMPFAAKNPMCTQDTGKIWKRASGGGYKYGTVGGKPSIGCNSKVTHLSLESTVYIKVSWGWSKVAGPVKNQNWGASSLTQKSVEYVCKKAGPYTHFRIVANGSVTYPGLKPIAGGAYSETDKSGLPCS